MGLAQSEVGVCTFASEHIERRPELRRRTFRRTSGSIAMATFGGYETVHEIYRHGLGSVSRAKVANPTEGSNGEPSYVVKAFQPPYRIAGQDAIKPAVRSFLDRARTQQDVVTAGAKHWAP